MSAPSSEPVQPPEPVSAGLAASAPKGQGDSPPVPRGNPPAIDFQDVHADKPSGDRLLRGITARVEAGSHTALVGRFGSGKSQLLRLTIGLARPTRGRVLIDGDEVAAMGYSAIAALRRRTGYVFAQDALLSNQSIYENIALPYRYHIGSDETAVRQIVRALSDELEIGAYLAVRPFEASLAIVKRTLVARALVLEPDLLLLEEPQTGLVPREQELLYRAIEIRRHLRGMTVIQTDHDGDFGPLRPERVLHMDWGTVERTEDLGPIDPPTQDEEIYWGAFRIQATGR